MSDTAAKRDPDRTVTVVFPATVVIDSREQAPFLFRDIASDARDGRHPITVPIVMRGLATGDYSVEGHEKLIAVERKSLSDLFNTIGQGRRRFERELARLNGMKVAAVVAEADWDEIINRPPQRSELPSKTVFRSVIAWQQRYPRVHWWMCPNRRFAEVTTLRILERYLKEAGAWPRRLRDADVSASQTTQAEESDDVSDEQRTERGERNEGDERDEA